MDGMAPRAAPRRPWEGRTFTPARDSCTAYRYSLPPTRLVSRCEYPLPHLGQIGLGSDRDRLRLRSVPDIPIRLLGYPV